MSEDFKAAVSAYLELHDEIDRLGKQAKELRKQKEIVGATILGWMKTNELDECELPDGKLVRKISKRTETMKKEYIMAELSKLTGSEAGATAVINNIDAHREIIETEVLSRTKKRSTSD